MNKTTILSVLAVSSLALTGCASQFVPGEPTEPTPASEAAESDPVSAEEAPMPEVADILSIGETAQYDDGLEVTATHIETVRLSEVASSICAVGDPVAVIELTVVNGTDYTFNPWEDFMSDLEAQYTDTSGYAVAADDVFDAPGYGHDYDLSGGQNFATLRPGQMGSDYYGFCTVDMAEGSLYLTLDPTLYDEPGYRDVIEWEQ